MARPVSVVEFSDFQGSFLRKFSADTLPKLKATCVKGRQARFSYRHFTILGNFGAIGHGGRMRRESRGKFWD
jgi:protein-disulfide isomerase